MGVSVFLGCSCIAFGPALALCLLTVAGDPLRIIVLVAGAFFWLVSLLLASLIWFISVHLSDRNDGRLQYGLLMFGAFVSVLLQETFRFAYFKLLKRADKGLATISEDGRSPISLKQMAYVSGLAFGIISGMFSVINILADSMGPGTVGIHGDSPHYFITSAFLTMALVLLHTFWGIIFFDACEKKRYWMVGLVVASHLLTSGLTFLNPKYELSLIPIFILMFSMGAWAFFVAGGSMRSVRTCLSCEDRNSCVGTWVWTMNLLPRPNPQAGPGTLKSGSFSAMFLVQHPVEPPRSWTPRFWSVRCVPFLECAVRGFNSRGISCCVSFHDYDFLDPLGP